MIEGSVMSWKVFENHLAPAAYFRDTLVKSHMDAYLKYNEYLVYLNNEKVHPKSALYKERFSSLNRFGMVLFLLDQTVYPKESTHFQEFYKQTHDIVAWNETTLYKNDTIGLKTLDDQLKVSLYNFNSDHCQFTSSQVLEVFIPFLYYEQTQIKQLFI